MTSPVLNNYIAGEFVTSKKQFEDINPVDGSLVAMVAEADREMVDKAVESAKSQNMTVKGRRSASLDDAGIDAAVMANVSLTSA